MITYLGEKYYDRDDVARIIGLSGRESLSVTLNNCRKRIENPRPFPRHDVIISKGKYYKVNRKPELIAWREWYDGAKKGPDPWRRVRELHQFVEIAIKDAGTHSAQRELRAVRDEMERLFKFLPKEVIE